MSTRFSIFLDDWAVSEKDIEIVLELAAKSIEEKCNDVIREFFLGITIVCDNIQLLKQDSNRKRFIDIISSVIGRSYLNSDNPKYSEEVVQIISEGSNINLQGVDYTQTAIDTMRLVMDDISRNG